MAEEFRDMKLSLKAMVSGSQNQGALAKDARDGGSMNNMGTYYFWSSTPGSSLWATHRREARLCSLHRETCTALPASA